MAKPSKHWTERSVDDFLYRIGADFVRQVESAMEESGTTQGELAERLGKSDSRVSQILNNPGNLTLRAIIGVARALGRKVSVVTYDDGDPANEKGPVRAEIFASCWEAEGRPSDFFELNQRQEATNESFYVVSLFKFTGGAQVLYVGEQKEDANLPWRQGSSLYSGSLGVGLGEIAATDRPSPSIRVWES